MKYLSSEGNFLKTSFKKSFFFDIFVLFFIIGIGLASYTYRINPFPFPAIENFQYAKNSYILKAPVIEKVQLGNNHYWIILPNNFDRNRKYPVIVYLHGRKYDAPSVDRAKLHLYSNWLPNITHLKSIIVLPTLPITSYPTWTTNDNKFIIKVIKASLKRYNQSASPLYLSGFSAGALHSLYMGLSSIIRVNGIGAFSYGLAQSHKSISSSLKNMPIFLAVGKKDIYSYGVVKYTYQILKKIKFRDITFRKYETGHWVHGNSIIDFQKWVLKKSKKYYSIALKNIYSN